MRMAYATRSMVSVAGGPRPRLCASCVSTFFLLLLFFLVPRAVVGMPRGELNYIQNGLKVYSLVQLLNHSLHTAGGSRNGWYATRRMYSCTK